MSPERQLLIEFLRELIHVDPMEREHLVDKYEIKLENLFKEKMHA